MILTSLGVGSIGIAYLSKLAPYKPIFVIITAIMLYWAYTILEKKKASKLSRIIFWISGIISIFILYYPTIIGIIK